MKNLATTLLVSLLLVPSLTSAAPAARLTASDLDTRRKALADLLDEQWEDTLRRNPEQASYLGDKRYNDKVTDESVAAILDSAKFDTKLLRRLEAIDTTGFSEQEKINKALLATDLRVGAHH